MAPYRLVHKAPRRNHQHGDQANQAKGQVDRAVNFQRLRPRLRGVQRVARHQNRQGSKTGQDIGWQFTLSNAEEQERHHHPSEQIERAARLIAFGPAALERPRQQRQPRQAAGNQERNVVPERRFMLGIFFRETLDMLHPEEVAPEVRLAFGDGKTPRQHYQRADAHRQPAVSQHFAPALTRNHPRQYPNHRHRQREEAFGHHPHPAGHAE